MAEQPDFTDSWDDMRSRTWDSPDASLEGLLATLGVARRSHAEQQAALRTWLHTASARPAPDSLTGAVRKFLAVDTGAGDGD